eukprot:scaffold2261_cov124-Cylindrotheca_fusiformis.AAC.7
MKGEKQPLLLHHLSIEGDEENDDGFNTTNNFSSSSSRSFNHRNITSTDNTCSSTMTPQESSSHQSLLVEDSYNNYSSYSPDTIHQIMSERMKQELGSNNSNCFPCTSWLRRTLRRRSKRKKKKHHRNHLEQQQQRIQRGNNFDIMEHNKPSSSSSSSNIVGWVLVWFLILMMGWVCVFTISEGHIDWADLVNYEPIHPSISLQQKAGFRTLTYMIVGYLVPGIVSLLCLFVGLKLPMFFLFWNKKNNSSRKVSKLVVYWGTSHWSVGDLMLISIFVFVVVGSFGFRFWHKYYSSDWDWDDFWHNMTKLTGMSLVNVLVVILFPICKTCFWWELFGLGFDQIVKFHRLLGTLFVLLTAVHGMTAAVSLTMRHQLLCCLRFSTCDDTMVTYGWYSGFLFLPVFITSLPYIRRTMYQLFFYSHFMVIPALIMAQLHHVNLIYYLSPGLTAYALDKVIGFMSTLRPVRLVDLSVPVPGYTRMVLQVAHDNTHFEPGQWIKINVPAISKLEWHPFSISSAPNHSTISLDIKAIGDWSTKLHSLARKTTTSLPTVYVGRFQGCHTTKQGHYLNHPAVFLVAGGIGVTPMMSALRMLVDGRLPQIQHLVFVWTVKHESVVDLYRDELALFQSLGVVAKTGCKLDILVYVTQSSTIPVEPISPAPQQQQQRIASVRKVDPKKEHRLFGPAPLSKTVMGHGHHALLMMAAGFGFLRGIVVGSSMAEENEWRQDVSVLLQLFFGTLLAVTLATVVLTLGTWFKPSNPSNNGSSDNSSTSSSFMDDDEEGYRRPLQIHWGQRPNIPQIVSELKDQCILGGLGTVGTTICGPPALSKSVMDAAYEASSPSVEFVVGEECFEW